MEFMPVPRERYRVPSRPVDGKWWLNRPEEYEGNPGYIPAVRYQDGVPVAISQGCPGD